MTFTPCKAARAGAMQPNQPITDFTRSHGYTAKRHYVPADKQELVACIVDGESAGGEMKARGGGYSLSPAQDADDFLIETTSLQMFLAQPYPNRDSKGRGLAFPRGLFREGFRGFRLDSILRDDHPLPSGHHLVYVEAGIRVKDLLARLAGAGLGIPTMGSGGSQTLAGAISTGTHGSDFRIPPLSDYVRAIHLVGPGGREWWIEPSYGIVDGRRVHEQPGWCPSTFVVRDDALFRAALVSVGRLGVIYALVLQVREDYRLEDRSERGTNWTDSAKGMRKQLWSAATQPNAKGVFDQDRGGKPLRYFAVTIDLATGDKTWLTRRWETDNADDEIERSSQSLLCEPSKHYTGAVFGLKTLFTALEIKALAVPVMGLAWAPRIVGFWGELMHLAETSTSVGDFLLRTTQKGADLHEAEVGPDAYHEIRGMIRGLAGRVLDDAHKPLARGPSAAILDQHNYDLDGCYNGDSTEIFFDAYDTKYLKFVDEVIVSARQGELVPGYISLRYVGRSRALLAMEQYERTVAIEIAVPKRTGGEPLYESFMKRVEELRRKHGGIPHWGQRHSMNSDECEALYGQKLETFRWAIAELQGEPARTTFSSKFTRARGLEVEAKKTLTHHRAGRSGGVLVSSTVPLLF